MNEQEKINILFLTRWYPHRYDPMPGLFVERHAEAVSRFCNVKLLYVHADTGIDTKYEIIDESKNEIEITRIYYKAVKHNIPLLSYLAKGFKFIKYNLKGIKHIKGKSFHFDIIHVNILTRLGIVALFEKFSSKTPYIITEHWSRYLPITNTYHGFLRKWITKIVVRNASAVTTVTENLKQAMLTHGLKNNNYQVIPNVVDTSKFRPVDKKEEKPKKTIIHISCFEDKSKNISGILKMAGKLSEKRDDFVLKMVGEGIDLDQVTELSKRNKTYNKTVFFTGLLENEDLIKEIQQADFLIMFSNYENMPVVINEALSCGIPVLSTNVGGIPEVINQNTGILINKKDEKELLSKTIYMLDNFTRYESSGLRKYAMEHFSNDAVAEKFYILYRSVLRALH